MAVDEVAPTGVNVRVDFTVMNPTSAPWRFFYGRLTLTDPRGRAHVCYRDPGSAPYEQVAGDGAIFVGGCVFQTGRFVAGSYRVSYDNRVLVTRSL